MKIFRKAALPAAIGVALSGGLLGTVQAATPGWYAGASGGVTDYSLTDSQVTSAVEGELTGFNAPETSFYTFNNPGSGVNASVDGSSTGFKVFGGYRFNEYVGVEVFYADLGQVKSNFTGVVDGGEGVSGNTKTDLKGYGGTVVASLPMGGGFTGFAKVGAFLWDTSTSGSLAVTGPPPPPEAGKPAIPGGDNGANLTYGVGVSYDVTAHIAVRIEYERFDYGSNNFDPNDVTFFSGGAAWSF